LFSVLSILCKRLSIVKREIFSQLYALIHSILPHYILNLCVRPSTHACRQQIRVHKHEYIKQDVSRDVNLLCLLIFTSISNVNDLLRRHIASYARLSTNCKRNDRCLELRYWYVIETCACVIWNKRLFPQRKKIKQRLKSLQKIKKIARSRCRCVPQQMFSMNWKETSISFYFYICDNNFLRYVRTCFYFY